jgi:hypothetical protein
MVEKISVFIEIIFFIVFFILSLPLLFVTYIINNRMFYYLLSIVNDYLEKQNQRL